MNSIRRYDLDKVYRFGEYNKTTEYGKANIAIAGVDEKLQELADAKKRYVQEVEKIVEPARVQEANKYKLWNKWSNICGISAMLVVLQIIAAIFHDSFRYNMSAGTGQVMEFFTSLMMATVPVFVITAIGKRSLAESYDNYVAAVRTKIQKCGNNFEQQCRNCYQDIDDLYLASLDAAHREIVLMRREQDAHNREMKRLEEERLRIESERLKEARSARQAQERALRKEQEAHNRKMDNMEYERLRMENERLNEAKSARKAQERLLEIEEEREKRRRKY